MSRFCIGPAIALIFAFSLGPFALAQVVPDEEKDAVRVTVTINPDGSRTSYEYNNPQHRAVATTTEPNGKLRGKIQYEIDDAGRFANGLVYGPDGKFRFKSLYKYDSNGRLDQETHLDERGNLINRLVYHYDAAGRSAGYSVYDGTGRLLGSSSTPTPTPKPIARVIR